MASPQQAYLPGANQSASAPGSEWRPRAETRTTLRQRLFEGRGWTIFRILVDVLALLLGNVAAVIGAAAAHTGDDGST